MHEGGFQTDVRRNAFQRARAYALAPALARTEAHIERTSTKHRRRGLATDVPQNALGHRLLRHVLSRRARSDAIAANANALTSR